MKDRRPYSLLQIRELGPGIHDLPEFDTSHFRLFAFRLGPHESRPAIDRSAETLLLVIEGSVTVTWREASRVSTTVGEHGIALTNPPAVEELQAGSGGSTFLALVRRNS